MQVSNEIVIVTLLIILNIICGLIGYLIGVTKSPKGVYYDGPQSFFTKIKDDKIVNSCITIDDKKFVTDIKTNNLERKYDTLGDVKKTEENITDSVNKLKNLKR